MSLRVWFIFCGSGVNDIMIVITVENYCVLRLFKRVESLIRRRGGEGEWCGHRCRRITGDIVCVRMFFFCRLLNNNVTFSDSAANAELRFHDTVRIIYYYIGL